MSEAPERIWATVNGLRTGMPGAHSWLIGGWEARAKQSDRETEYVHNDLFDAVKAERDNYKALYEAERDDELLNIARQAGHQDGAEERRRLEARVKALTGAVGESVVKLDHAASIIRNNYLHQPEKCDDARSICVDLATDLRAALQENTNDR